MKYIYLITSPSGKQYVGKSTIDPDPFRANRALDGLSG